MRAVGQGCVSVSAQGTCNLERARHVSAQEDVKLESTLVLQAAVGNKQQHLTESIGTSNATISTLPGKPRCDWTVAELMAVVIKQRLESMSRS